MTIQKLMLLTLSCLAASASLSYTAHNCQADNRHLQHGTLEMEEEKKTEEPFSATQDRTIEVMQALDRSLASGSVPSSAADLSAPMIQYLNGAYLYCSVNLGICPFILDALLEIDVINSRGKQHNDCPTLKAFWKEWLSNNMEERQNYLIRTGFIPTSTEFKKNVRPRYINCQVTVVQETADSLPAHLKIRYADGSPLRVSLSKTVGFLKELKVKVPNVLAAVGMVKAKATKDAK